MPAAPSSNLDDAEVARLAEHQQIPTRTFAVDAAADWRCHDVTATAGGSTFALDGPEGQHLQGSIGLAGAFNVVNAVTAITAIAEVGLDAEAAAEGIGAVTSVPGRMEPVVAGQGFTVIVDYAHKPDAVTATLDALRPVTEGRLMIVVGAGETGTRASGR